MVALSATISLYTSARADTENNGGHSHAENRPLTYRGSVLKVTNSTDLDSTPYGVMGFTKTTSPLEPNWGWAYVEYETPQAAGIIVGESELKLTTNDCDSFSEQLARI